MCMNEDISEPQPPDAPMITWVLAFPIALAAVAIVLAWTIVCVVAAILWAPVALLRARAARKAAGWPIGPTAGKSAPQEP